VTVSSDPVRTDRHAPLELEIVDDARADVVRALVAPGATLRTVATGGAWFEGPVWLPARHTVAGRDTLVWSDVVADRLLAYDDARGARTWVSPSFHQNGHTLDADGRILAASHGERAVVRRERDGSWTVVADLVDGHRFNSPNDLVVAADGAVWFTDPYYGLRLADEGYGGEPEVDGAHVYRVDPRDPGLLTGANVRAVDGGHPAMPGPNGLAFSPDESVLYVTDSEAGHVLGYAVRYGLEGPVLGFRWTVHLTRDGRPDGLRVDPAGRLWVSSGAGVEILSAPVVGRRADLLAVLHTPRTTANLAFSPDLRRLALTSTDELHLVALGDVTR